VKTRLADLDGTILQNASAEYTKLIAAEMETWGKVIRAANIKPD